MTERTDFPLVFAIWGAGLGAAGQYAKVSIVFDKLAAVYPDAGVALGFVVSLVGFVGILLGVVAGLVVARIRYRRALLWALWAGAGIAALEVFLPPLPIMLALRGLEGVSHLAIVVCAPTLIAQLSAPRHRGLTLTLWSTFFGVAFTLLVVLGLPLVSAFGLPALFAAHAVWMAAFALLLGVMLPKVEDSVPPLSLPQILRDHGAIYRSPRLAAPAAGWLFYTFCFLAILTVLPPYIDAEWRAWVLGSMPLASIAVSMTLGVYALRFVSAVGLVQIGFTACIASLLWLLLEPGDPLACMVLAGALGLIQGASFAAVPQLNVAAADQAKANGAMAQMGNLGNTLGTPALLAVLSVAGYAGLIWTAAAVLGCGIGVHLWMARRRLKESASAP
ncbi:MAG: MFS transporter [Pseudomonadota bacterium]